MAKLTEEEKVIRFLEQVPSEGEPRGARLDKCNIEDPDSNLSELKKKFLRSQATEKGLVSNGFRWANEAWKEQGFQLDEVWYELIAGTKIEGTEDVVTCKTHVLALRVAKSKLTKEEAEALRARFEVQEQENDYRVSLKTGALFNEVLFDVLVEYSVKEVEGETSTLDVSVIPQRAICVGSVDPFVDDLLPPLWRDDEPEDEMQIDLNNPVLRELLTRTEAYSPEELEEKVEVDIGRNTQHFYVEGERILQEKDETLQAYVARVKGILRKFFGDTAEGEAAFQTFWGGSHQEGVWEANKYVLLELVKQDNAILTDPICTTRLIKTAAGEAQLDFEIGFTRGLCSNKTPAYSSGRVVVFERIDQMQRSDAKPLLTTHLRYYFTNAGRPSPQFFSVKRDPLAKSMLPRFFKNGVSSLSLRRKVLFGVGVALVLAGIAAGGGFLLAGLMVVGIAVMLGLVIAGIVSLLVTSKLARDQKGPQERKTLVVEETQVLSDVLKDRESLRVRRAREAQQAADAAQPSLLSPALPSLGPRVASSEQENTGAVPPSQADAPPHSPPASLTQTPAALDTSPPSTSSPTNRNS